MKFEEDFDEEDGKIIGMSLQNLNGQLAGTGTKNILGYDLLFRRSFAEFKGDPSQNDLSVNLGTKQEQAQSIPNQRSLGSSGFTPSKTLI